MKGGHHGRDRKATNIEIDVGAIVTELELLKVRLEKTHHLNFFSECSDEAEILTVQIMTAESLEKGIERIDGMLEELKKICPNDDDEESQVEAEPTHENLNLEATAQVQA